MAIVLTRAGQALATGDENALFLKKFAGEVLATFREKNLMMPITQVRTISDGKSAIFPVVGTSATHRHTAGESVLTDTDQASADYLDAIKSTEKEIFIDDPLISAVMAARIDVMKSHWDVRSKYVDAIGRALALQADRDILSTIQAAGKAANTITAATAAAEGRHVTDAGAFSSIVAADIVSFAFDLGQAFDELNVPAEGRYLVVRPAHYKLLSQYTQLVDRDFSASNGDYSRGAVYKINDFTVLKSANMKRPTEDLSAVADAGAKNDPHAGLGAGYNANFAKTVALGFQSEAVGTVKLADISIEHDRLVDRLSDLYVASYMMGHGILRPECAGIFDTTT